MCFEEIENSNPTILQTQCLNSPALFSFLTPIDAAQTIARQGYSLKATQLNDKVLSL